MTASKPNTMLAGDYPPEEHLLRDLNILLEPQGKQGAIVRAPVVQELCTDQGTLYAGVMAALVDTLGGTLAIHTFHPDWLATSSMSLYSISRITSGKIKVAGSVLQAGKTTAVMEVDIHKEVEAARTSDSLIGSGIMTFSRLILGSNTPAKQDAREDRDPEPIVLAAEGPGLSQHILDKVGTQVLSEVNGEIEVAMSSYIRNSFGSLHGGIIALLGDLAGQVAARAATGKPMVTSDLTIHYLSQGRTGPFRTKAAIRRKGENTALTRVELFDCGDNHRLIAVIINRASPAEK